jgi:hypothetical protein
MKKLPFLIAILFFALKLFSQSYTYTYTYTAGKIKFAVIINENKVPKSGEMKWGVTVFDVYNRIKTQTEKTDDPLEIDPFLVSAIIKIDKAKMNAVLFKDTSREIILQDLFNKFIKDRKEEQKKEEEEDKKKKEEEEKTKNEEAKKKDPLKTVDSKSLTTATIDTFTRRLTIDSSYVVYFAKKADNLILTICNETGEKEKPNPCYVQAIAAAVSATDFKNIFKILLQKHYAKPLAFDEAIDNKIVNIYTDWKAENEKKEILAKEKKQAEEKLEKQKIFDNRLAEIGNEAISYTGVGRISLKDTTGKIKIYKRDGSLLKETTIDTVSFLIEDGKIMRKQLYVKTREGYFLNKESPIPVNRINERGTDILCRLNMQNDGAFIRLGELFEYTGNGYVPDDTTIILTPEKRGKNLSATSNLNSLINFSIYTDLAGLLGRRANGIINTDVSGKFIINTRNFYNWDATPITFVEGNVVLSKFDSKFKSIDSSFIKLGKNGEKDTVDRMQLIQTAWLKGSIKFNLLAFRFFYYQNLYLNIGTRINVVNGDSLFRKDKDIIFFDYYPELVYSINKLKNFGMDLSLRWLQQKVADKEPFANSGWESVFNPQIAFFYYPLANQSNKIYFRFNYFANRKKDANNFYQLQFGIKTALNFGSKK